MFNMFSKFRTFIHTTLIFSCIKLMLISSQLEPKSSFTIYKDSSVTESFTYNYFYYKLTDVDLRIDKIKCLKVCNKDTTCNSILQSTNTNANLDCIFYSSNPEIKNGITASWTSMLYVKSDGYVLPPILPMSKIMSSTVTSWGIWHQAEYCPPHSFAIGFLVRIDDDLPDVSGINTIQLICNDDERSKITSGFGSLGVFTSAVYCPYGKRLNGFRFKSQSDQESTTDYSATNSIRMFCEDGTILVPPIEGSYGTWTSNKYCLNNQVICGISAKIQAYQYNIDNTGLNNVHFNCCST